MIIQGLVTATSVMVQDADLAQIKLLEEQANVSVGLHFNMASHNNNATPFLNDPYKIAQQFYSGKLKLASIEKELEAQYIQLKHIYAKNITHVDTHQHIHIIPKIAGLLKEFAQHNNIPYARLGKELSPGGGIKKWLFNNTGKSFKNSLPLFGLNIMEENFNAEKIRKQFDFLKANNISKAIWMVHPGYETTDITFTDTYNKQRENDMLVLTQLKEFIYLNAEVVPLSNLL